MPPSKFKPKQKRDRKAEAVSRLRQRWEAENEGETWEAEREPVVTPLLKSVEGGIPAVIAALRTHDDDDAKEFLECLDSLSPTDRSLVPVETVAFCAGIGSLRLAELAQTALFLYASMETKMLISGSMAKVTKAIVKTATDQVPITAYDHETGVDKIVGMTNGDVKAMELFGRISGIAPVPKGAQIAIQNNYGNRDDDKPPTTPWKSSEERLREFQDMTEPKRLPTPASIPVSIGGHIDATQAETLEILRGE